MLTCHCGKNLAECQCPDTDARLRGASDSPYVMFKWCRVCDRHYARCRCARPDFGLRSGGAIVPLQPLRTLAGIVLPVNVPEPRVN